MAYQAVMMLMVANNVVMCRAFFSTLEGIGQRWFTKLLGESIDTFYDLAIKFTTHFMKGKKAKKFFSYLEIVKQRLEESLIDFLVRWRSKVVEVEGMDEKSTTIMLADPNIVDSIIDASITLTSVTP